jgi:hypothetical protein
MNLADNLSRRIRLFREEVEQWRLDHAAAMSCLGLEDTLAFGLSLWQQLTTAESRWYASVDAGDIPFDESEETTFAKLYALWLIPCDSLASEAQRLEAAGFHVDRANDFRDAIEQARSSAWTGDDMNRTVGPSGLSSAQWEALAKQFPPAPTWFQETELNAF